MIDGARARQAIDAEGRVKNGYIALKDARKQVQKARDASQRNPKVEPPHVVVIQDPRTGKTVEAVRVSSLKAAGVEVPEPPKRNDFYRQETPEERQQKQAAVEAESKARLALLLRVREAQETQPRNAFDLLAIVRHVFDALNWQFQEAVSRVWGEKDSEVFEKRLGSMNAADLTRLLLDCTLIKDVHVNSYNMDRPCTVLLAAARHYGVNVKAARASSPESLLTPSNAARATEDAAAGAGADKADPPFAKGWSVPDQSDDAGSAGDEQSDVTGVAGGSDTDPGSATYPPAATQAPKRAQTGPVKYRNAMTGETWSGRGLQPAWLKAALAAGKTLADFEVGATAVDIQSDNAGVAGGRDAGPERDPRTLDWVDQVEAGVQA